MRRPHREVGRVKVGHVGLDAGPSSRDGGIFSIHGGNAERLESIGESDGFVVEWVKGGLDDVGVFYVFCHGGNFCGGLFLCDEGLVMIWERWLSL